MENGFRLTTTLETLLKKRDVLLEKRKSPKVEARINTLSDMIKRQRSLIELYYKEEVVEND